MRAFVYTHYGSPDLLRLAEIAMPAPRDNEVLVKICAASVNPLDWHVMRGHARMVTGVLAPRHTIPGSDIAGRVEAIGRDVKRFQPGDEVFGGRGVQGGGFAEYVCAVEGELVRKPAGLSFEDAAAGARRGRHRTAGPAGPRVTSRPAGKCWWMAPPVEWARLRSRLRKRLGRK
jgi:NADPH:quinone reductase-like Zn-dependent oxidoreductase